MNKKTIQAGKHDIANVIENVKIPAARPLTVKQADIPSSTKKLKAAVEESRNVATKQIKAVKKESGKKVPGANDVPLIEEEAYFVYLKNPLEYRRHLLECSKRVLLCLRSHQKLLLIRQKKLESMSELRSSVKELLYLNKKFNEMLPKYNMAAFENQPDRIQVTAGTVKAKAAAKTKAPVPEPVVQVREKTELEKLEESLASIEKKLRSLQ